MGSWAALGPERKTAPLNVEALPGESIEPITHEVVDGTTGDAPSRKKKKDEEERHRSTAKHSQGSPSRQSPMGWLMGDRVIRVPENKTAPFNIEALPRVSKSIKPTTREHPASA
jgi:hypothetical protein